MKKRSRILMFFTFVLITLFSFTFANVAQAESLPPGFLVGDDTGLQAGTDGEYFIVHNDIYPGLIFHREITLSNYSQEDGEFAINLVMNPEDEEHVPEQTGIVDLFKAVRVKLTYQNQVIYEGTIDGDGTPIANKKTEPIDLGVLEVGEVRNIQAEFTVSPVNEEFPFEDWENTSSIDFYWLFYASRQDTPPTTTEPTTSSEVPSGSSELPPTGKEPPTGKLPQTGEDWRNVLLGMIAGFVLITVALIIAKKQHQKQN